MTSTDSHVYNGMPATDLGEQGWESPWSGPNGGQCVQRKLLGDGRVGGHLAGGRQVMIGRAFVAHRARHHDQMPHRQAGL